MFGSERCVEMDRPGSGMHDWDCWEAVSFLCMDYFRYIVTAQLITISNCLVTCM